GARKHARLPGSRRDPQRHRIPGPRRNRRHRWIAGPIAVRSGGLAMTRGLIVAAVRSGGGKTTVALGLMRALRRRGQAAQPFKCGPDYIDPAFHAIAAGRPSFNLNGWAMTPQVLGGLVGQHCNEGELAIAEGVMGLFDGVGGRGATADLAALLGWPVVLVL